MAREVLVLPGMKPHNPDQQNQGEGDRLSARRYNRDVRRFVADGKVEEAARDAKDFVEKQPGAAARAEARARRGPHGRRGTAATVDELIAKGRTIVDRIKPVVERVTKRVRRRLHRK